MFGTRDIAAMGGPPTKTLEYWALCGKTPPEEIYAQRHGGYRWGRMATLGLLIARQRWRWKVWRPEWHGAVLEALTSATETWLYSQFRRGRTHSDGTVQDGRLVLARPEELDEKAVDVQALFERMLTYERQKNGKKA